MGKVYARFQTKTAQNHTLWGGTHLYGLYKEVPRGNLKSCLTHIWFEKQLLHDLRIQWKDLEALISGHPRDAKKVTETGAGRLWECKNTEFVSELSEPGFCEGGRN